MYQEGQSEIQRDVALDFVAVDYSREDIVTYTRCGIRGGRADRYLICARRNLRHIYFNLLPDNVHASRMLTLFCRRESRFGANQAKREHSPFERTSLSR